MVCVAAPVFLWRIGEFTLWPTIKAVLGAVALTAVVGIFLVSQGTSANAGGMWFFLTLMVAGSCGILILRMRKPWLHHTIGMHDETVMADVLGGEGLTEGRE